MATLPKSGALAEADARAITAAIRAGLVQVWDLIAQAYAGRVWVSLGYDSWDDYCESEFGGSRIRLPREERQGVVASLAEAGLSNRAIAAATGTNRETVRQELAAGGKKLPPADDGRPASRPITGLDGKEYRRPEPQPTSSEPDPEPPMATTPDEQSTTPAPVEPDVIDAEVVEDEPPLAMPQPPRLGPRSKHREVLGRITNTLQGCDIALAEINQLDRTITHEEAGLFRSDLARSRKSITRMIRLLEERTE